MVSALTEEQLNKALKSFKSDFREGLATKDDLETLAKKDDLSGFATKDDLKGLATNVALVAMEDRIKHDLDDLEVRVIEKFSDLQTSVDRYLKFTEAWHQELTILKSRQDRLTQVLVDKGVVSQQEVALLA
jgi:hypothetical protein